jgi:hypothetical protein
MTTLRLGNGDVGLACLNADDGAHGILFHRNEGGSVGKDTGHGECRTEDFEPEVFLEITSSSRESLQVIINTLEEAMSFFGNEETCNVPT